jgi:hypothetical protein
MTRVARKVNERRERVPARRVRGQTLAGAIVGAIVAVVLMMFSAPAKAGPANDRPGVAAMSITR